MQMKSTSELQPCWKHTLALCFTGLLDPYYLLAIFQHNLLFIIIYFSKIIRGYFIPFWLDFSTPKESLVWKTLSKWCRRSCRMWLPLYIQVMAFLLVLTLGKIAFPLATFFATPAEGTQWEKVRIPVCN